MNSNDFWAAFDKIYEHHGSGNEGVVCFISDIEPVIENWESEEHDYKYKPFL